MKNLNNLIILFGPSIESRNYLENHLFRYIENTRDTKIGGSRDCRRVLGRMCHAGSGPGVDGADLETSRSFLNSRNNSETERNAHLKNAFFH